MLPRRWVVKPSAAPDLLARYDGMSPVLAQVLYNRSFTTPHDAARFLRADADAYDPFQMKGMHQAVRRIVRAIEEWEPVVVYGDFDADGVTATALLVQALRALDARVTPYIPHRVDEGYGLNSDALLKLARGGAKLVITVDCGIRSVQEVEDGKAAGLDIIVTDHHSLGPELPDAFAVINPKQDNCKYGEDMLAGVGIAYKLAEALFLKFDQLKPRDYVALLDDLVDLVAIGTVADLAPLNRPENRMLVRRGLALLNQPKRQGLRALSKEAGLKAGAVNATSIGFAIGPRINAAGRLESAMLAYDLLMSDDIGEAQRLAEQLQELNKQRQELTREAQATIRARLEDSAELDAPLIFASDRGFKPGIVGLVAGRLTEEFYRPSVIMEEGAIESRASCRSIPQFDITAALDQCADLLVRHGGHAQAAGFTIRNENIPAFKRRLMDIASRALDGQDLTPSLEIDVEVDARHLSDALCTELAQLEPTGHHNTTPVFVTRQLRVQEHRTVGTNGDHLKLRLARSGQPPLDAIGFRLSAQMSRVPNCVDVAYVIEFNEYNGNRTLQLNVQDISPAGER